MFCFFVLLFLDSCISGTAGSGKTELANDVSKIIGKSCYIFNCSAGMNYSLMEKFFKVFFHRKFDILSLSTVFRQLSVFFICSMNLVLVVDRSTCIQRQNIILNLLKTHNNITLMQSFTS